ncbi:MAG: ribonuclease III [Lactobacillales bacterium]|nr:ribonuclease III [Lactobacillales bacterium]
MEILNKLDIKTSNEKLYQTALTHTSYANEHGLESYERLEYLGDAVLELVMSEYLYTNGNYKEGEMTKLRAHYVCEDALYEYSINLGLNEDLRLGNGELQSGGKYRKAIVADIYEAFIGAIFLDQGFIKAKEFIYESAIPYVENNSFEFIKDYKSELQELVQTDKRSLEYSIINEEGPAHNKTFTAVVKIDNILYGTGISHSKKDAEQLAAKDALLKSVKN